MNLADALGMTAERSPGGAAISFEDHTITYAELDAEATRFAAALAGAGVEAGGRVALWLPNHPVFASAMYGAWRMGAIVVPVHAMLTEREARHVIEDSGATVLVCGRPQLSAGADRMREAVNGLEHLVVLGGDTGPGVVSWADFVAGETGSPPSPELADDHLALIAYTSGTAGLPKGAMLTHRNLRANLDQMAQTPLAVGPADVTLCVLPLFHIFGLNVVLNLSISMGTKVVVQERFDPSGAIAAIREHGVTVVAAAPPVYVAWLNLPDATADDFRGIRLAVSGAAPLPRDALTGFADRFGVTLWEGYGLTETSPTLTSTRMGGVPKPGSVGKPIPGVEIRLVAPDGADAEPGDPGEVCVRGPNVFVGYWQQPKETEAAFLDGWFRTGDVGIFDDDGYLYLVDRRRDMIIVSGFNVYPKEVENALREHPSVMDTAVVGQPDPHSGEHVKAFVVPPDGITLTPEEIAAFCSERLASYKVPAEIEIVSEIPRNAAGKVLRRALRG